MSIRITGSRIFDNGKGFAVRPAEHAAGEPVLLVTPNPFDPHVALGVGQVRYLIAVMAEWVEQQDAKPEQGRFAEWPTQVGKAKAPPEKLDSVDDPRDPVNLGPTSGPGSWGVGTGIGRWP